jgi:hypothetical protein
MAMNESSKLIPELSGFLAKNATSYNNLQNIIVVNGPGSFTGLRTIVLVANSIAYSYPHVELTTASFFQLFDSFPILKRSSKRDLFIKKAENIGIEVQTNEEALNYLELNNITKSYGDFEFSSKSSIINQSNVDYQKLIQKISFSKDKRISAHYIKKPNID